MPKLQVTATDIERIADKTLLSYGRNSGAKQSAFWVLLALSAVIATAGVMNDSDATVIGAMIVAPLMTPILGVAFAIVMADRRRAWRSMLVVAGGALLVIAVAYGFGLTDTLDSITTGNGQVAGRVNPKMIDLIAAIATGLVGAFALVRADVSDTLPGVAIAISLVPPLAVVGLTLEEGKADEAAGALLLFGTNVTAIIFTATLLLLVYKVRDAAAAAGYPIGQFKGRSLGLVALAVAVIAIPLAVGTQKVVRETYARVQITPIANEWAEENGWEVERIDVDASTVTVTAVGRPPEISPEVLRQELDDQGFTDFDLRVELIIGGEVSLPGTG